MMEERGIAVGFCDTKEKEGPVVVGKEPEALTPEAPEILEEPETLERETEAPEEVAEEEEEVGPLVVVEAMT
jgi:hypothetical protein